MVGFPLLGVVIASEASDAAQNVLDSLNQSNTTGWDLVAAGIVIMLSVPTARLVKVAIRRAFRRAGIVSDDAATDVARAAKWLVYLLALAGAASILGVDIGFLSVLFILALVIGALALKPMIENSASGVLLIARPAFSVGDQIKTKEFRGVVEEIGSRSTRLRQSDGVIVHISNNQVLGNPIMVYSEQDSRKGSVDVTVPWDSDLDVITSTLIGAISVVDDVVDHPAPAVQAIELSDDSIKLEISYWYPSSMLSGSRADDRVIRAVTSALRAAGIAPAVPTTEVREAHARPDDSRAKDGPMSDSSDDGSEPDTAS